VRKVYFEIDNGKIVDPRRKLPPAFYAVFNWRLQITEIKICFARDNIENYGEVWKNQTLEKEGWYWDNYKWLMNSLKHYILKNMLNIIFNRLPDEEQTHKIMDRFIYHTCWIKK
jgi:hypothetical protein